MFSIHKVYSSIIIPFCITICPVYASPCEKLANATTGIEEAVDTLHVLVKLLNNLIIKGTKSGTLYSVRAGISDTPSTRAIEFEIFDGEKKVGGGSRNLAAFPATNYLKGSMFLDIKGDGIATAIYKVYLEAVPSGSTLLLGSANKETNIFLDKMLRDSSIDLNDNSTVRKIASQWLTNEIATLSYNEYPVWLKVIEKSGWKLLQIEFLGVSDKGMGLYIFHMQKP